MDAAGAGGARAEPLRPRRRLRPRPLRPPRRRGAGGASRPAADEVAARVLESSPEQTGYPRELLDMDLDLEADLGIDTVKQAEVFAAIREAYGIERDDRSSCATTRP